MKRIDIEKINRVHFLGDLINFECIHRGYPDVGWGMNVHTRMLTISTENNGLSGSWHRLNSQKDHDYFELNIMHMFDEHMTTQRRIALSFTSYYNSFSFTALPRHESGTPYLDIHFIDFMNIYLMEKIIKTRAELAEISSFRPGYQEMVERYSGWQHLSLPQ